MNKVRSRLDKALKLMMVCLMTVTCFSDFPVRVIAETLSVDSVIRIESDGSAETADPAVLNIQVVLEDQTITETRSVASGTLSISAMEGYELDTMSLDGVSFDGSVKAEAKEHVLVVTAHRLYDEESEDPELTVEPTSTPEITPTPEGSPEPTSVPEVTATPETTATPQASAVPEAENEEEGAALSSSRAGYTQTLTLKPGESH